MKPCCSGDMLPDVENVLLGVSGTVDGRGMKLYYGVMKMGR